MKIKKYYFLLLLVLFVGNAQNKLDSFFTPKDSLSKTRVTGVIIGESVAISAAFVGLHQLWYANYPKSSFHYINDNAEWLQMDKIGHFYSAYHLSKLGTDLLNWSGVKKENQLVYGAGLGFLVISAVEVFDGFSKPWGASKGDLLANAIGSSFFVAQELLWQEQRITPKLSFHYTPYASVRPNVLGASKTEQILKDYNGQTYWLSCNVASFIPSPYVPKWLNFAVGYGAEGMVTANKALVNTVFFPEKQQTRQFYASLDVDLSKIKTKHAFLNTVLRSINMIKIPAPTFEINDRGSIQWHDLYF